MDKLTRILKTWSVYIKIKIKIRRFEETFSNTIYELLFSKYWTIVAKTDRLR